MQLLRPWTVLALGAAIAGQIGVALAGQPTAEETARQIDESLAKEVLVAGVDVAPRCDDATFLRRAWLDVVGDIPTPEHLIAFTLDTAPDKRAQAVRALLAERQYGLNWARYWRDVIFSRRIEDRALIAVNALESDLAEEFNANAAWDEIASKFITATGDVRENGAAAIIMAQEGRTEETTAEVARILLGMQIQCAQCHDHPYDRWKREQFHELAAFFPRIGVRPVQTPTRRSFQVVASDRPARPRASDNGNRPTPEHYMPDLDDPSAPGTRMQPKFFLTSATLPPGARDAERRETLAAWLTESPWFAEAAVNRMWAELVGEGFYPVVDDIGPDRTARAPETLKLLAQAFRDSGYKVKWLVETIAATEAYQRESRPRAADEEHVPFAANVPQPLRADQLFNAVLSALDVAEPRPPRRPGQGGGAYARQRGPRGAFEATFGYDPSEPREAIAGSIPQALAMMNSPQAAGALKTSKGGMLASLVAGIDDDEELFVELYLRMLSRQPTAEELAHAQSYVDEVGDRKAAIEDLAWALLNSAEFRHRR